MKLGVATSLAATLLAGRALAASPLPTPVEEGEPNLEPPALRDLDIHEHLGAQLPLDLAFRDQTGKRVTLRDTLHHDRPVIFTLVYFDCPMLCSLVMEGLAHTLSTLSGWRPGQQYDAVTLSFNPDDTPDKATDRRRAMIDKVGATDTPGLWPFLLGDKQSIAEVTKVAGFDFRWDPETKTYAHNAVVFVLTPDGKISRYLYGVHFEPLQLRLALTEAGQGKSGSSFERFLLSCYHYDPAARKYGMQIVAYYRAGGALILAAVIALFARLMWRERHPLTRTSPTGSPS